MIEGLGFNYLTLELDPAETKFIVQRAESMGISVRKYLILSAIYWDGNFEREKK